jgi:hypothetical protein
VEELALIFIVALFSQTAVIALIEEVGAGVIGIALPRETCTAEQFPFAEVVSVKLTLPLAMSVADGV